MELWLVRRTHTRGVYTHEKTPFLLSGLAEPNWASTESSARGSTRKRAKLRRERDLSDRLTTKLWTDTSPSSPYHFARCHAVIPVPLSYPRLSTSNLPFSLLFVAREADNETRIYTRPSRKPEYRAPRARQHSASQTSKHFSWFG